MQEDAESNWCNFSSKARCAFSLKKGIDKHEGTHTSIHGKIINQTQTDNEGAVTPSEATFNWFYTAT